MLANVVHLIHKLSDFIRNRINGKGKKAFRAAFSA